MYNPLTEIDELLISIHLVKKYLIRNTQKLPHNFFKNKNLKPIILQWHVLDVHDSCTTNQYAQDTGLPAKTSDQLR